MSSVSDHLCRLIAMPSRSEISNREVIEYAAGVLRGAGWQIEEVSYMDGNGLEKTNLLAAPAGTALKDIDVDLAFFCHTDTVPPREGWVGALAPRTEEGCVHGCGACDVKGFLACLLSAVEDATTVKRGVRIVLTADEEIGCVGAKHLLSLGRLRPRRAVVGEPTSLQIAHAGKGYCLAEVKVTGKEAHSALPDNGASAIYAAAKLIARVELFAEQEKARRSEVYLPPYTTVNVGLVKGGSAKNIVPGECSFLVEWRPIPMQQDRILQLVEAAAEEVQRESGGVSIEVKLLRRQAGFETAPDAWLVQTMKHFADAGMTSIAFGSEASLLTQVAEEVVVFGPGDMNCAHSDRENVPIAELEKAVSILQGMMAEASNV